MKFVSSKSVDMGNGPILPIIMTLAIPAMISMFFQNLYAVIDTVFISWLGAVPLAAQTFAIPLFYVALSLGKGVQVGTAVMISRARGRGETEQVEAIIQAALPLLLLCILPLFVLLMPGVCDAAFGLIGARGIILEEIFRYTFWLILGFPLMAYVMICESVFMSHGNTVMPMQAVLLGNGANLILAPILMFGFGMGIAGASLATLLGQALSAFYIGRKLKLSGLIAPTIKYRPGMLVIWKKIGRQGFLVAITFLVSPLGLTLLNGVLSSFGAEALGAWNIMSRLAMLGLLPLNGMAASMISFMSFNYAQMKVKRIVEGIKYFLLLATLFILPVMLLFIAFPHILLLLFQAEGKVMELGSYAIRVAALGYILVPVDLALFSLAQGLQKPLYSLFTLVLRILVLRYPLAVYLALNWGVRGVYWCEPISMGLAAIFSALLLGRLLGEIKKAASGNDYTGEGQPPVRPTSISADTETP